MGGTRPSGPLKVIAPRIRVVNVLGGARIASGLRMIRPSAVANEFGVRPGGTVSPGNPDVPTYGQVFPSGR